MATSKMKKFEFKQAMQSARQAKTRAVAAANDQAAKYRAQLSTERKVKASESLVVGAGTFMAAGAASQVWRELGTKRDKPGLARAINYGAAALGIFAASKAKPSQSGMRKVGASMAGMGAGQLAIDLQDRDLVPGFNG